LRSIRTPSRQIPASRTSSTRRGRSRQPRECCSLRDAAAKSTPAARQRRTLKAATSGPVRALVAAGAKHRPAALRLDTVRLKSPSPQARRGTRTPNRFRVSASDVGCESLRSRWRCSQSLRAGRALRAATRRAAPAQFLQEHHLYARRRPDRRSDDRSRADLLRIPRQLGERQRRGFQDRRAGRRVAVAEQRHTELQRYGDERVLRLGSLQRSVHPSW
jgi:hypothetical protein